MHASQALVIFIVAFAAIVFIALNPSVSEKLKVGDSNKVGEEEYVIESYEFTGNKTFANDERSMLIETKDRTFTSSINGIEFYKTEEKSNVVIEKYDMGDERITVNVNSDDAKGVQRDFAKQFNINIEFLNEDNVD